MHPARFLSPQDVREIVLHYIEHQLKNGNTFMLALMDRAFKSIFAYPLPFKVSELVASNLLALCQNFGVPHDIRIDAGGNFTSEVMKHSRR